jgi:hypothetical protein
MNFAGLSCKWLKTTENNLKNLFWLVAIFGYFCAGPQGAAQEMAEWSNAAVLSLGSSGKTVEVKVRRGHYHIFT